MREFVPEKSATRVQPLPQFDVLVRRRGDSKRFSALESFPLEGTLRIGSDANNDIVLDGRDVELRHAVIDSTERGARLGLLGSAEASVGGALARGMLGVFPGDSIVIGGHRLTVELRDNERAVENVWTVVTRGGRASIRVAREIKVGRAASNDLVLSDAAVSASHARLIPLGGFLWVRDESGGQTFIDNVQVTGAALLHGEDRLRFGPEEVFVVIEGEVAAEAFVEAARAKAPRKPRVEPAPARKFDTPASTVQVQMELEEEPVQPRRVDPVATSRHTLPPRRAVARRRRPSLALAATSMMVVALALAVSVDGRWRELGPWVRAEFSSLFARAVKPVSSPPPMAEVRPDVSPVAKPTQAPVVPEPPPVAEATVAQVTPPEVATEPARPAPMPERAARDVEASAAASDPPDAATPESNAGVRDAVARIERALESHRFAEATRQLAALERSGISLERRTDNVDAASWNRLRVAQKLVRADALLQQRQIVTPTGESTLVYLTDALRLAPGDPVALDISRKAEGYLLQQARHAEEDGRLDEFRRLSELAALVRESTRS